MQDTVVLIHGLWLHDVALTFIRRGIERRGHVVRGYSYPTVRVDFAQNIERLRAHCTAIPGRLHFVGQSMGGLLALKAAALVPPACRGRVVLVGTPVLDSYAARLVQRLPGGRTMLGRCIGEWLRGPRLAVPDCEVGIIAGSGGVGLGRIFAPGLPKPHDGVVCVSETQLPGARDHIVLPVSHTQMLVSPEVVRQICAFLEQGRFERG